LDCPKVFTSRFVCGVHQCQPREARGEQFAGAIGGNFLPLYASLRRWKTVGDAGVAAVSGLRLCALGAVRSVALLQIPGVAKLVGCNGAPTALPTEEIEALKKGLSCGVCVEPHPFLTVGGACESRLARVGLQEFW